MRCIQTIQISMLVRLLRSSHDKQKCEVTSKLDKQPDRFCMSTDDGEHFRTMGSTSEQWGALPDNGEHFRTMEGAFPDNGEHFRTMGSTSGQWGALPNDGVHFQTMGSTSRQWGALPDNGGRISEQWGALPHDGEHFRTSEFTAASTRATASLKVQYCKRETFRTRERAAAGEYVALRSETYAAGRGRLWKAWQSTEETAAWQSTEEPAAWQSTEETAAWQSTEETAAWQSTEETATW